MNIAACRPAIFLLLLSTAACQNYQFEARAEEKFSIAAEGVTTIGCTTHNGRIEIVGTADATSIEVTVAKTTRGETQALADAGLTKLEVVRDRTQDQLDLGYRLPKEHDGWSGHASFTVTCPIDMIVRAKTHNGHIELTGVGKRVHAESHNGGIHVEGSCDEIATETHNGAIHLELTGTGTVTGSATTHNGGITLELSPSRSAAITANTHNGSLRADEEFSNVTKSRRSMSASIGAAPTTKVKLQTHNGNIRLAASETAEQPDVRDG